MHELQQIMIRGRASAASITDTRPQIGDTEQVLMAKLLTQMRADASMRRSGLVYDKAGLPAGVKNTFEDVAANETYEELVAQPVDKRICILGLFALGGSTATTITLYSKIGAGAAVAASPTMANIANGGEVLPIANHPWLTLPVGAALGCGTSNHAATGVIVVYFLEPNYLTDENGIVLTDEDGNPLIDGD